MFKKLTNFFVRLVQKYLPDALLFAIILTFITFIGGIAFTGQGPVTMLKHWGNGMWSLLAFSMQMAIVLVSGHTLATSPPFKKLLKAAAKLAKTPKQAVFAVALVTGVASWINWGFGLVIGALYARELARQIKDVDYTLLIASSYGGFVIWHGGISGSIPLTLATDAAANAAQTAGAVDFLIPISKTIFAPWNLIMSWGIILTVPFLCVLMHPTPDKTVSIDPAKLVEAPEDPADSIVETPADKLETSKIISYITGAAALIYVGLHFAAKGFDLNLNILNTIFLGLSMIFHQTPRRFIKAFTEATTGAAGILMQFPLYAGIMGMMTGGAADGISLAGVISNAFVRISTETTFPLFSFWSAGIVNFFVPSGGGQWAVQAPIMMPAGADIGLDPAVTAMAIAWGDSWTNMVQPFWALPALGIAGLGAKDILGYCTMVLLWSGLILSLGFLFLV